MGRTLLVLLPLLLAVSCQLLPLAESPSPGETPEVTTPLPDDQQGAAAAAGGKGQKSRPTARATQSTRVPEVVTGDEAAAWTIMVYMNAGSELEEAAKRDLEEMAAPGSSPAVNLLVQVGSRLGEEGTTRRYRLGGTGSGTTTASPPLMDLGAVDVADPAVLADFVRWGMADYPARHFALIVWDYYGGGWQGLVVDEAGSTESLAGTVVEALAGIEPLDVVAFDAGRMGQLEVYQALSPHARNAVASAGLWPAAGRDYEQFLAALNAAPEIGPPALATLLVDSFFEPYLELDPDAGVTIVALDLAAVADVTAALNGLATTLTEDPELVAPAVGDARAGAENYAGLSPADQLLATSVDLGHFAYRLKGRSPDPAVAGRARVLAETLAAAVISQGQGDAFPQASQGVLFYFPASASSYQSEYAALPSTVLWHEFLSSYHPAALETIMPPDLNVVHVAGEVASVQQPAFLDFELVGRDVETLAIVAGRQEAEGRLRLLGYYPQLPAGEFALSRWQDGVHEGYFVWETLAGYLSDGSDGEFVLFWPADVGAERYVLPGRLQAAGTSQWQETTLVFDARSGDLNSVWVYRGQSRGEAPRQLVPQPGTLFQPYHPFLTSEEGGQVSFEPGATLTFSEAGALRYAARPLPEGEYTLGMMAETMDGERSATFTLLDVTNPEADPAARAYLDPLRGFQFLYPASWPEPKYTDEGFLRAGSVEDDTQLTVTLYPESQADDTASLKTQALQQFGPVDLLYQEEIFVGEVTGTLVAYGYEATQGSRTGIFFTFVREGVGYVVDVDGPAAAEAETISLADQLVDSWLFRPLGVGSLPGQWTANVEGVVDLIPAGYVYEELENGWQRFKGDDGFIAFREEPAAAASREELVKRWLRIAGDEVDSFTPESTFQLALGGNQWVRAGFTYDSAAGQMQGFVMATIVGGEGLVAWGEAEAATFPKLEQAVFLVMAAERLAAQPGEAGLLYEAPFSADGTWGTGTLPGVEGEVEDGVYSLAVEAEEGFFWSTAGQSFVNATYEVTGTQTAGPLDNGYGLLFRADNETDAFYVFEISGDGYAWIGRCDQGCSKTVTLAGEGWFPAPSVQEGLNVSNRLRVDADGPRLTFFVNDHQLAQLTDAALSAGDIGLFVETLGEGGVEVAFSALRVYAR